jgi:hypothetical protein
MIMIQIIRPYKSTHNSIYLYFKVYKNKVEIEFYNKASLLNIHLLVRGSQDNH